jgi:hypothetical protein
MLSEGRGEWGDDVECLRKRAKGHLTFIIILLGVNCRVITTIVRPGINNVLKLDGQKMVMQATRIDNPWQDSSHYQSCCSRYHDKSQVLYRPISCFPPLWTTILGLAWVGSIDCAEIDPG